ncbi:hypothetical protein GCM10027521_07400 [Amycolatopsis cihanbeyliensis]
MPMGMHLVLTALAHSPPQTNGFRPLRLEHGTHADAVGPLGGIDRFTADMERIVSNGG